MTSARSSRRLLASLLYGRKVPGLDPKVADTLRAHHAESPGHLLGAPGLVWDAAEKERAKRWLRKFEERQHRAVLE